MASTNSNGSTNAASGVPFDLHNQNLTYKAADGVTDLFITMGDVNSYHLYQTKLGILYSTQMGACFVMAIVLLVLTSRKNYRQPIFILNFLSLVFGFIRALFLVLFLVSPWVQFYNQYSGDFSDVPASAYRLSVAATIFPLLMLTTVSASLMLQAHAVCKIMDRRFAWPLIAASLIVVLLSIGFRFAQMVTNSQAIMGAIIYPNQYLRTGSLVTSTLVIWWFSAIFCYKLVYTCVTRHRNGWRRYSTLRVLAIMSGCTMLIPSIFAILQYAVPDNFPEAGTVTLTVTALLLPLSSLWARLADQEEEESLRESIRAGNQSSSRGSKTTGRYGSQSSTVMGSEERKGSIVPLNKSTIDTVIEHAPPQSAPRDSTEMDLEKMGIRVGHSYEVSKSY